MAAAEAAAEELELKEESEEVEEDEALEGDELAGAEQGGDEENVGEGEDQTAAEEQEAQNKATAAKGNAGADVNVDSFEELVLDPAIVQAANDAWRLFINTAASREAAGEAIYAALFESAPSLQSLFVTPRAVQAMKFMNGLVSFVTALKDPPKLKILVETLGFAGGLSSVW